MIEQKLPFSTFFIILLIIVFSFIGIVVRNVSIVDYPDIDYILATGISIFMFLGFLSYGFPLKISEDKLELNNIFYSSLSNIAFYLPTILLPCFNIFSNNKIAECVILCLCILIWSIFITTKTIKDWRIMLDFISSLWVVSGVLITIGLIIYDYAQYSISLITTMSNYFDIRYILTGLIIIIFISRTIKDSFSKKLPEIVQIKPLKITVPENLKDSPIISILYSFIFVPNILMLIIFTAFNVLWNIVATISIIAWRLCSNFLINIYNYFSSRQFWMRMGYALIIVFLLLASELLINLNLEIVEYIKTDAEIFDFTILRIIALWCGGLFLLTSLIFTILHFLKFQIGNFTNQLQFKLSYFFLLLMTFCASGWILFFIKKLPIFYQYDIPNIGPISILVAIFVIALAIILSIIKLIKKTGYNNV